jgi:hypothetical protein
MLYEGISERGVNLALDLGTGIPNDREAETLRFSIPRPVDVRDWVSRNLLRARRTWRPIHTSSISTPISSTPLHRGLYSSKEQECFPDCDEISKCYKVAVIVCMPVPPLPSGSSYSEAEVRSQLARESTSSLRRTDGKDETLRRRIGSLKEGDFVLATSEVCHITSPTYT